MAAKRLQNTMESRVAIGGAGWHSIVLVIDTVRGKVAVAKLKPSGVNDFIQELLNRDFVSLDLYVRRDLGFRDGHFESLLRELKALPPA